MGCGKSTIRSTLTCYKRPESLHKRSEKIPYEKHDQISPTHFLVEYGGLYLYGIDIDRINTIDD